MRKKLVIGGLLLAGILGFAGTCTIKNVSLTKIGTHDVFAGEIHNDSGVNILGHNIIVAFLDSSGTVLETKTVSPCLRTLQNGSVDFFSATSSKPAADTTVGLARINFDSTFKVGVAATGDVTISNVTVARKSDTTLVVAGTVKNLDATKLTDVVACIVVYTSTDTVVLVAKDTSLSDLAKNASDSFSITVTVPDSTSTVEHVDVWVDGLQDGVATVPESSTGHNVTVCGATKTPTTPTATPVAGTQTAVANTQTAVAGTQTAAAGGTQTAVASLTPPPTNTPVPTNTTAPASTKTPICN